MLYIGLQRCEKVRGVLRALKCCSAVKDYERKSLESLKDLWKAVKCCKGEAREATAFKTYTE